MGKVKKDQKIYRVIEEVTESAGLEQKTVLLSFLWKFDFASGSFNKLSETNVYRDRVSEASGLSGRQISDEITRKKHFLEELTKPWN